MTTSRETEDGADATLVIADPQMVQERAQQGQAAPTALEPAPDPHQDVSSEDQDQGLCVTVLPKEADPQVPTETTKRPSSTAEATRKMATLRTPTAILKSSRTTMVTESSSLQPMSQRRNQLKRMELTKTRTDLEKSTKIIIVSNAHDSTT